MTLSVGAPVAYAATFTVTNTNDSGAGSLRQAVLDANGNPGPDTIDFFSVTGTITLTSGQLTVTDDLTIDGPGAATLTVSGGGTTRVLEVGAGVTFNLEGVTVANGSAFDGGGIKNGGFFAGGTLTVTNVTFSANAAEQGGGIYNSGTLTVTNSTFSGNSAGAGGFGGAIFHGSSAGTLTVTDSWFSGNSARFGGGIFIAAGNATVSSSTFSGNSAGASGGGIHSPVILTITNSTFAGNSGGQQGGGLHLQGLVTITNSTLSGNAANQGGGIFYFGGSVTLRNTIVANSPSGGNCFNNFGPIGDGGGNLTWPDTTCPGINVDPMLEPLANYGGPTPTMALPVGSPAIDTAVAANCPPNDQRGVPRPQGPGCDIGAFELEVGPGPPAHLMLEPEADTNEVRTEHCVTATVTDANDNPVPDVTVRFSVSGRNNRSGSVTTDENGQATFCYTDTGTVAGPDTIKAYADTNDDEIQDPSEPFDVATKIWFCPPGDDDLDDDGLDNRSEDLFGNLLNNDDSDDDGIRDGNDDGDDDGEDDEDEDDGTDPCPDDGDGDGEDDEDEDDEDDDD